MKKSKINVLLLSKWDEDEEKYVTKCCAEKSYNLSKKEELKELAINSLKYLVKGYRIELISVSKDFIFMMSKHDILYIGYTNRYGEYHEFNISDIIFPSEKYGNDYFDAFCIDEDGEPEGLERTFKIERIDFIRTSFMQRSRHETYYSHAPTIFQTDSEYAKDMRKTTEERD